MGQKGGKSEKIRSALFVDFDNIFIRFENDYSGHVANCFASSPESWVAWIEREAPGISEEYNSCCRRLLVRRCYMNPEKFSDYRRKFTQAAFEVIDCPPLTEQGKTSTDMHLVIDSLDALANPVHFDEFIILSGDADFTPLLRRLRLHDRLTTIFSAGQISAAYKASCDSMISVDKFISQALGINKIAGANGWAANEAQAKSLLKPYPHDEQEKCKPTPTQLDNLISKICEATEIPVLSGDQYAAIFDSLAREINSNGFDIDITSRNVQIMCAKNEMSVMEDDIDTVIKSCNRADHWFTKGKESADSIAKGYRKYITELCRMKNIKLNEDELELLYSWITSETIQSPIANLAN